MSLSNRSLALALLLGAPLCGGLSGCVVAAGAGVGYLVSQEVLPNQIHTAQVRVDVDEVWDVTTTTLGYMVDPGNEVMTSAMPREASAKIDGADVLVTVEAYDLDRTIVHVQADRPLRRDGATAQEVLNEILDRIDG